MEQFFVDYFERLQDLHRDFVAAFEDLPMEALDWVPGENINSLCVLVVHTVGATRFWIGDVALEETSNRDRSAEFKAQGLSVVELKGRFATLEEYAHHALERLTLADLAIVRSVVGRNEKVSVSWALLHALEHTGLHLGHAQLMRQFWELR
ncbi:MAG: DinB family protein [Chloroflexi bacterium]|nr:DinB family protein [Chloroflexota bacterium]